jgi:S-adenosylmethionine:tRNA ribosyltransferase-isomerase
MAHSSEYDYDLPTELVAQRPLKCRSDARLLIVDRDAGRWQHSHVRDLPEFLAPRDALVLNDTRVLPARLEGYRTQTGGRWSGLFLTENEHGYWKILSRTRGKLQAGESVTLQDRRARDHCRLVLTASLGEGIWVARPESPDSTLSLLENVGRVPLPPYIRGGKMVETDVAQYQTVYATHPGAVAAPTAGLHFTQSLLDEVAQTDVDICRVTLHVGLGTFRPMSVECVEDHQMHAEWACLEESTVDRLLECRTAGGRVVAVGTTVVRTLETAAHHGALAAWSGETDLYIHPPYEFRAVDALLTNFHLPRTSLLVLVRAFGGDALIRAAYQEAIREQYRFYSYGDAMLIL